VLPGPVLRLCPNQCYVERILPIGVPQISLLSLFKFWPMIPALWYIYVLEEMIFEVFFVLYWFADRVTMSFKVRNVVGKGCIPHFHVVLI
jgi:hypothetical protein